MEQFEPAEASVSVGERLAPIAPSIFGGLAEHFGTSVNDGMWDRVTGQARPDVKAALKAMGTRLIRYPGGCYSASYHWRDGVGPVEARPHHERTMWTELGEQLGGMVLGDRPPNERLPDPTPQGLGKLMGPPEPNIVGTDEMLQFCTDIGAEAMFVANLGTGTPDEAADWVAYANRPASPGRVTWWGVGNETYGSHEPGHSSPEEYGRKLAEFSRAMKAADPTIQIIGVGLPVFPDDVGWKPDGVIVVYDAEQWNRAVLEAAAPDIDALSLHWYFPGMIGRSLSGVDDYVQLVTSPDLFERAVAKTLETIDQIVPHRRLALSVDEWNRMVELEDHFSTNHCLADAGFFAGVYTALLTHADRVRIGCISHLVNCLAPIQAPAPGQLFVTSAYLVAQLYSEHARGWTRQIECASSDVEVPMLADVRGDVGPSAGVGARTASGLVAAATSDGSAEAVFLTSRELRRPTHVSLAGLPPSARSAQWRVLSGPDLFAANTPEQPNTLYWSATTVELDNGRAEVTLPPGGTGALLIESATAVGER